MDKRVTGLLDLAEVLKDSPPANMYQEMPLSVRLSYATREEAAAAAEQYGATVRNDNRYHFWADRGFGQVQGEYWPGAELTIMWARRDD